ncbi:hypothetical protein ON010_g9861 [Phytophthora cinnamomi]|nr:hypothetical protein ON010_g9861 [Phytophthora cinnamomi]
MGPGRYGPILLQCGGAKVEGETKTKTRLQAMRWGLVPSFTKPNVKPDHFLMFNARSENLQERPAFKRLLESKRCVVLCEGYYEWQQVDKREKQPYYFYREDKPMKWKSEDGEVMCTYTILTTAVAPELKWLHTRMPVILSDEGVDRWLSGAKFEELKDLLASYRSEDLKWYPVDKKVGSMKFQSEDCAKKINIKHAGKRHLHSPRVSPPRTLKLIYAAHFRSPGNIKSFFSVKTEKQEIPSTPTARVKEENKTSANEVSTPPVKAEEHDDKPETTPKKEFKQFPTKFIPASSLLTKRSDDKSHDSPPPKSPSKRRRESSPAKASKKQTPPAKTSKLKSAGPTQSSLDFFFGKGPK